MKPVFCVRPIPEAEYKANTLNGRFLQSAFWCAFKAEHGWKPLFFKVTGGMPGDSVGYIAVLCRTFSRFVSICYVPMAPDVDNHHFAAFAADFAHAIKPFLPRGCLCVRFDPPFEKPQEAQSARSFAAELKKTGFLKPHTDVQPPDTVLLDLRLTETDLLSQMKPKWRYNIKLAEKKGVTVRSCGAADIETFYTLYLETAKRDGIAIHSKDYYRSLLERSDDSNKVTLYIAEHEGDSIAAIITLFTAYEAVYLYGASANTKRNLMAAYFLQWTAICDAQKFGAKVYDFYGIPPNDDKNHPMHGLYRFKTGFGGSIIHRAGSIDFPISVLYRPYATVEYLRAFWFKKINKLFVSKK